MGVAPHAGAWIETMRMRTAYVPRGASRPTRARGLKLFENENESGHAPSRPTRARGLKPSSSAMACARSASRPTRARGLKRLVGQRGAGVFLSRPTRARGLKPHQDDQRHRLLPVAPHAGAWIETATPPIPGHPTVVAPHAGAWIETECRGWRLRFPDVAPHAGAWIETPRHRVGVCRRSRSRPTRARGLKP